MKKRGFQLSSLTIAHFEFLYGICENGYMGWEVATELANTGLRNIPQEARNIILPINYEVIGLIVNHYRSGRKKIAIYKEGNQRYITADFLSE